MLRFNQVAGWWAALNNIPAHTTLLSRNMQRTTRPYKGNPTDGFPVDLVQVRQISWAILDASHELRLSPKLKEIVE